MFQHAILGAALLLFPFLGNLVFAENRDPRQLSFYVGDIDGTLFHNVGNYRVKRVAQIETASPFIKGISGIPMEVRVPVHDFEGNIGPQIGKRLGTLDERGRFIASTSLDIITLSNGEKIIPGLYYLDPQTSYQEFRPSEDPQQSDFLRNIEEKIATKTPFLLEAFPFLSIAMDPKYREQLAGAILTMQGQDPRIMKLGFNRVLGQFKIGDTYWPEEAFVNLTHPDFMSFAYSKNKFLLALYDELANRVIQNKKTPHFLVFFENDRVFLRNADELFQRLSRRGVFANPVVPILVNLVEKEVFENPDGTSWDRSPMEQRTKMSRVTVYWPDRIERTNELSRIYELTLQMEREQAKQFWQVSRGHRLMCKDQLIIEGGK